MEEEIEGFLQVLKPDVLLNLKYSNLKYSNLKYSNRYLTANNIEIQMPTNFRNISFALHKTCHGDAAVDALLPHRLVCLQCKSLELKLEEERVFTEYEQVPKKRPDGLVTTAALPENTERNRFRDVVPYEENRVELVPNKENNTGYINASHIKVGEKKSFWYRDLVTFKQSDAVYFVHCSIKV